MRTASAVERIASRHLCEPILVARRNDITDCGRRVGMLLEELREALAIHLDYLDVGDRAHAQGARFAGHQRHLAGEVSADVVTNVAGLAVRGVAKELGGSAAKDEHRIALLALAYQQLACAELARGDAGHPHPQLV